MNFLLRLRGREVKYSVLIASYFLLGHPVSRRKAWRSLPRRVDCARLRPSLQAGLQVSLRHQPTRSLSLVAGRIGFALFDAFEDFNQMANAAVASG